MFKVSDGTASNGTSETKTMKTETTFAFYLITPKSYLPKFKAEEDRAYFSKPVLVIPQYTTTDRLLWVTDPHRGETYPVDRKNIFRSFQLSKRQLAAAGGVR